MIFCEGLKLTFCSPPPLSLTVPPEVRTSPVQTDRILPMLPEWLDKGYVREILKPEPLFFSRMFTVPKPEKGVFRPIIDLSFLNSYLVVPKFRMNTMSRIVRSICPGMWGSKIDLDNAYYSVAMLSLIHI